VSGILIGVERVIDGGIVIAEVGLEGSTDAIVLLDPERRPAQVFAWHPFPNVLRVTCVGEIVWRSALVPQETTAKCWLGVEWVDGALRAWTYSFDCELDPGTGQIVRSTFTK
jgi:hypothetical protein